MDKGKCRARVIGGHEWIEGAVYDDYIIYDMEWDGDGEIAFPKFIYAEIDPETVGRCTEKIDTNENLIFEGDIVIFKERTKGSWDYKGVVEYSDSNFVISCCPVNEDTLPIIHKLCTYTLCSILSSNIKIIGNIYDNPERLNTPVDDGEDMDLETASEVFELELEKTGIDENLRRAMETAMKVLDRQAIQDRAQ